MRIGVLSLLCAASAAALPAQEQPSDWKLHPTVQAKLADAAADERLPVYFVMRDRLGYHHWFPRVTGMHPEERRALVVRELKDHARRTQAGVWDHLSSECDRGNAGAPFCNWLGNFVRIEATPDAIRSAAAYDEVWEVRYDCSPSREACEDSAALPPSFVSVGTGPAAVGADRVWALGIDGSGVIVMNADSGINLNHKALENRLWTNSGEIPGNGVDDDGNGFADDVHGWNFGTNDNNLNDGGGHGTKTAGVLVGDGSCGTSLGIAPGARVMTGRLMTEADQWEAIQYAIEMGAHVQTSSHSYKNNFVPAPNYAMHRDIGEISLAAGLIRTNSTSNNGWLCQAGVGGVQRPFNVSAPGNVPSPYRDPNQALFGRLGGVIGVGAHLLSGELDGQSPCGPSAWHVSDLLGVLPNYPLINWDPLDDDFPWMGGSFQGLLKPDVVAPTGTQTATGGGATCSIGLFGGTSNATPVVAGCLTLWKSANMSLNPEDIAMIVHQSSSDEGLIPGKENTWGAGKINAYAGLQMALNVHRVNGQSAWEVVHQSGTPITFEVDGSEGRPVVMVLGLVREEADLVVVKSGVGSRLFSLFGGWTDNAGNASVTLAVPAIPEPVTIYTQTFIDDRGGPSGQFLASNVVGTVIVP